MGKRMRRTCIMMMSLGVCGAALVSLLLQPVAVASGNFTGHVRFRVVDSHTGQPVAGAAVGVHCTSYDWRTIPITLTDKNGQVTVEYPFFGMAVTHRLLGAKTVVDVPYSLWLVVNASSYSGLKLPLRDATEPPFDPSDFPLGPVSIALEPTRDPSQFPNQRNKGLSRKQRNAGAEPAGQ